MTETTRKVFEYLQLSIYKFWCTLIGARCLIIREGPMSETFDVYWFRTRWSKTSHLCGKFMRDPEANFTVPISKALVAIGHSQKAIGIISYWKYKNTDEIFLVSDLEN